MKHVAYALMSREGTMIPSRSKTGQTTKLLSGMVEQDYKVLRNMQTSYFVLFMSEEYPCPLVLNTENCTRRSSKLSLSSRFLLPGRCIIMASGPKGFHTWQPVEYTVLGTVQELLSPSTITAATVGQYAN